ncbi:hypothetical protein [Gelidibacter sp.]|uniref:hypothetical protein n=1 Tax=Gelidibacter sp. TaxID=2018083 RepID=UPI002BF15A4B|nr:hypothetical protein [Gelidibacter sp.]HUH29078.1 hypothetical protein [Gelidibacter sp.]
MNSIRIFGLIILIIAIIFHFSFENDGIDFLTGLLIGGGIALLLIGKVGKLTK